MSSPSLSTPKQNRKPKPKASEIPPGPTQTTPPPAESPKFTQSHLIVAKAVAYDAIVNFEVAMTGRKQAISQVQEIQKYLEEYEKVNRNTPR